MMDQIRILTSHKRNNMMKLFTQNVYASMMLLLLGASASFGYQPSSPRTKVPAKSSPTDNTRRSTLLAFPAFAMIAGQAFFPSPSRALDFDSFMANELANDNKKVETKMSEDEALCRFGSPSKKTGEACLRAGRTTKRPTGVDAFGNVDREFKTILKWFSLAVAIALSIINHSNNPFSLFFGMFDVSSPKAVILSNAHQIMWTIQKTKGC